MSASLNKVQIIGNLGKDPEIRFTGDNKPIANVTVATTDTWKDKNTGERQERTEWHRVVIFGGLADVVQKYMKKGDAAYFEGRLQTRKWQGQDGQDRYTTEIVVDNFNGSMQMLGRRSSSGDSAGSSSAGASDIPFDNAGSNAPSPGAMKTTQVSEEAPFDDDIPF